jgi:hypothetical protein
MTATKMNHMRAWVLRMLSPIGLALLVATPSLPTLTSVAHAATRDDFYSPTVTVNPACGSAQQYYPFVDFLGNASDYTYANGNQWCVRADWYFPPLNVDQNCQIFFYVPLGNATSNLTVGLFTRGAQIKSFKLLSEAPVSGYHEIWPLDSAGRLAVAQVNLGDNTGESYPTMLGWGATNSVEVRCS